MSEAWTSPETDVDLLRAELDACRTEIARLRGAVERVRALCGRSGDKDWQYAMACRDVLAALDEEGE